MSRLTLPCSARALSLGLVPSLLLFLGMPATGLSQLSLTVHVVDSASAVPIAGAVVSALPQDRPDGQAIVEKLSGADGRLTFHPMAPGRYVLRVRRVGYVAFSSPPFELGADTSQSTMVIRVPPHRIVLSTVTISADRRCAAGYGRAADVSAIWTAAQTTLASAALIQHDSALRVPVRETERYLDADGKPLYAEPPAYTDASPLFTGASPTMLSTAGYIMPGEADRSWTFHAPDVEVLRSPEFERDHCFRVLEPAADGDSATGMLKLAFEPHRERRVPEIAGVLWIDSASTALRRVTFRFVNARDRDPGKRAGGHLTIDSLPSGAWGVSEWELRVPRFDRVEAPQADRRLGLGQGVVALPSDRAAYVARGAAAAEGPPRGVRGDTAPVSPLDDVVLPTGLDCDEYGSAACLRHAYDYLLGTAFSVDQRRASAYYLAACRSGPSIRLQAATYGRRDGSPVDTAAIDAAGAALDELFERGRGRVGGASEASLTARYRDEYQRRAQLDACVRVALAVLTDPTASVAYLDAALLLTAGCDELEPIACSMLGLMSAAAATSAQDTSQAVDLLARGCGGRHADGCRALFRLRPGTDPDAFSLRGRHGQGGKTAGELLATWVAEHLGADRRGGSPDTVTYAPVASALQGWLPFADVRSFPKGVLIRIWSNRPVQGFAGPLDPLGPEQFRQLAGAMRQLPERRFTFVMHSDSLPPSMILHGQLDTNLGRQGQRWLDHLRSLGVARRQLGLEIRGYRDPIAWNGTLLGREQNRRIEIIVR